MRSLFAVTAILAASTVEAQDIPKPTKEQMFQLIGSFMEELVYLNRLSGIGECAVNGRESIDAAMSVWESITGGEEMQAFDDSLKAALAI